MTLGKITIAAVTGAAFALTLAAVPAKAQPQAFQAGATVITVPATVGDLPVVQTNGFFKKKAFAKGAFFKKRALKKKGFAKGLGKKKFVKKGFAGGFFGPVVIVK